ncbi:MAG: hypothetical protein JXN59_01640 [Anaerolineae bacterium]|nr:hypothetical protein [Anaerolineae bacterium]
MDFDLAAFLARVRTKEPAPAWQLNTALGLLIAYFVTRVVALALVSVLLDADAAAQGMFSPLAANLAGIVTGLVTLALIALALRRQGRGGLAAALRLGRWPGPVLMLMIFSIGMAILIDFVPLLFGTIGLPVALQGMAAAEMPGWLVAAAHVVVVGPLAEMALVQGVLYPALAARRDNLRAVLFSAAGYAVIQVFDNPADLVLWSTALLAGVYFGLLRAHQKSTRATVIAAAMFGAFALFKALRLFL